MNEKIVLKWKVHPAKKDKLKLLFAIVTIAVSSIVIYISFKSLLFLFLTIIFLTLSISKFLFPTTYIITEESVIVEHIGKREKKWKDLKRYIDNKEGVLISPFTKSSKLDNYRGFYLYYDNNREEVLEVLSKKLSN